MGECGSRVVPGHRVGVTCEGRAKDGGLDRPGEGFQGLPPAVIVGIGDSRMRRWGDDGMMTPPPYDAFPTQQTDPNPEVSTWSTHRDSTYWRTPMTD